LQRPTGEFISSTVVSSSVVTHVVGKAKHDLGRTVPSGGDVLGHEALLLLLVETTSKTKVADLELTVGIDEKVSRFEVAVEDIGRVDVFEAAEGLVDEGLEVGIGEGLAGADLRGMCWCMLR
jgi:hypothetical protein